MGHFPSAFSVLNSRKPRLAYLGFLGDGNVGDEMVFWAARKLFDGCHLIPIKRRTPIEWKGILRTRPNFFDGVVQGGGTLIGNRAHSGLQSALLKSGLPIYTHGTGVLPTCIAPDWRELKRSYGGVRGLRSAQRLSVVADLPVIGDAAIALDLDKQTRPQGEIKRVLLNLGVHAHNRYERSEHVFDVICKFAKNNARNGFLPTFLPMHSIDQRVAQRLKIMCPELDILDRPKTLVELEIAFEDVVYTVGERLHFVIASVLMARPFYSINYADKHADFLESIGLQSAGTHPEHVTHENLNAAFCESTALVFDSIIERLHTLRLDQQSEANRFLHAIGKLTCRNSPVQ